MTDWRYVDEATVTAKFDAYVRQLFYVIRLFGLPEDRTRIERGIELRTDVFDLQLHHIRAAQN